MITKYKVGGGRTQKIRVVQEGLHADSPACPLSTSSDKRCPPFLSSWFGRVGAGEFPPPLRRGACVLLLGWPGRAGAFPASVSSRLKRPVLGWRVLITTICLASHARLHVRAAHRGIWKILAPKPHPSQSWDSAALPCLKSCCLFIYVFLAVLSVPGGAGVSLVVESRLCPLGVVGFSVAERGLWAGWLDSRSGLGTGHSPGPCHVAKMQRPLRPVGSF